MGKSPHGWKDVYIQKNKSVLTAFRTEEVYKYPWQKASNLLFFRGCATNNTDNLEQPNLTSQEAFEQGVGSGNLERMLQTKIIVQFYEALKKFFANSFLYFLVFLHHLHFMYTSANCYQTILQVPFLLMKKVLMDLVEMHVMRIQNKICQSAWAFIF